MFSFFSSQWRIKLKTNQTWNSLWKTPYQNTNKIKTALKLKIHQSYDLKIADRILCSFNSLAGSNQTNPHASKLKYECVENAKVISYHLCNFTNIYCLISFSLHHILPLIPYLLENFWASWLWILLITVPDINYLPSACSFSPTNTRIHNSLILHNPKTPSQLPDPNTLIRI